MSNFDLVSPLQKALDEARKSRDGDIANALAERARRNAPFTETLQDDARNYRPSPELVIAVNVALSQGRPLLLTGEPGSGKTQAVYWIALLFGLKDRVLEYQVRSESRAKELRYDFDAVSWFRESQIAALNKDPNRVPKSKHIKGGVLGKAFGWDGNVETPYVVLIDEIDKAPRDFPNDLLLELSQMRFKVEDWDDDTDKDGNKVEKIIGPPRQRPFIVITSNAERRLPEPFLRRCVVHDIKLDEKTVTEIFATKFIRFGATNDALAKAAASFWVDLSALTLSRKPTIAELWQNIALETTKVGAAGDRNAEAEKIAKLVASRDLTNLEIVKGLFSVQDLQKIANKKGEPAEQVPKR